jgi:hypothetical protein
LILNVDLHGVVSGFASERLICLKIIFFGGASGVGVVAQEIGS